MLYLNSNNLSVKYPNLFRASALITCINFFIFRIVNGIYITYPNGQSKILKFYNSPKVLDGSIITITSKMETEPFNITEYITNLTSIYSELMQAYLIVLLAARN